MDYEETESKRFLRLANRLLAFEGVLTARYLKENESGGGSNTQSTKIDNKYKRQKLYREANIKTSQVEVSGPDYLQDKLAQGPTL